MNHRLLVGYKLVINKQGNFTTRNLQKELRPYLPNLKVETDVANGDVVFRTNQLPNEQFVQALRQLDVMKEDNRIKNYGVQNSTMDDVFLKITRETNDNTEGESTAVDVTTIGKARQSRELRSVLRLVCRASMRRSLQSHRLSHRFQVLSQPMLRSTLEDPARALPTLGIDVDHCTSAHLVQCLRQLDLSQSKRNRCIQDGLASIESADDSVPCGRQLRTVPSCFGQRCEARARRGEHFSNE